MLGGDEIDRIAVTENIGSETSQAFCGPPWAETVFLAITPCVRCAPNHIRRGGIQLSAGLVMLKVSLVPRGDRESLEFLFLYPCEVCLSHVIEARLNVHFSTTCLLPSSL